MKKNQINYSKISKIIFDGIDYNDSPDYCDAYIVSAVYEGEQMTEEQLEEINENKDFVHEKLLDYLY